MSKILCLDKNYSTTQLLTQEKPILEQNVEDKFETALFLPEGENRKGEGGLRTKGYFKKSYDEKPLISIITVVFNGEKHLEQTIESVINQSYDNVEYIIIDGGSTDGTIEIIKQYEDQINYWISEKDRGISNAFNKGIISATGDIIGIINADDDYTMGCIDKVMKHYEPEIEMYYGNLATLQDNGEKQVLKSDDKALYNLDKVTMTHIYHPTFFINRRYYKHIGLFNEAYTAAMDYEFLSRGKLSQIKTKFINEVIAEMRSGGISDTMYYKAKAEVIKAYKIRYNKIFDYYLFKAYYVVFKAYIRHLFEKNNLHIVVDIKRQFFGNR